MSEQSTALRAAATVAILTVALVSCPAVHAEGPAGDRARLQLADLSGAERSLAALRGNIVVVNFWATWCLPCREELPMLEHVAREFAAREVLFVAASADDDSTRALVPAAVEEAGITFEVWAGATTEDMQRMGLGSALPATAVVDRDGSVAFRLLGVVEEAELRQRLDWLLGARDGAAPKVRLDTFAPADDAECCDHGDEHDGVAGHDDHGHEHEHVHHDDHDHEHAHGDDASLVPS